jgi:pectin methylesterase-like acyl-CoA thioesterase
VPPGQAKKAGCSATISKTIGGAIAAAAADDTVFVFDGSYNEMVTIDSTLTGLSLLGRDPKKTIISAGPSP